MGLTRGAIAARVGYAIAFVVALPALLVAWARALDGWLVLPGIRAGSAGGLLAAAGLLLWAAGVVGIVRRGGGLPMNAFPPPRLVTSGAYRLVRHPIYVGFVLVSAGVALAAGSPSGLLVVTPVVALGCAALVIGLEAPDLLRRFGAAARFRTWLSLPADDVSAPEGTERLAVACLLLVPWLTVQRALAAPAPLDAAAGALALGLATLVVPTRAALRAFAIEGLVALGLLSLAGVCAPPTVGPAFAVGGGTVAARALARRSRPWAIAGWTGLAALVAGCLASGRSIEAVAGGGVLAVAADRPHRSWRRALDGAERLANSWRAWRVGPVRIISHGVYAGAGAVIGVAGIGTLAGRAALPGAIVVSMSALIGAGLWAQWVEGSPRLLRPFGYYGSVAGAMLGVALVATTAQPAALILAATAVVAPWLHAVGRLRCLVQGCCHGRPVDPRYGIRVVNEHSRVVALAGLADQPIHATPLYSIAGNVVIGVLQLRLWAVGAPIWFIGGSYLVLAGIARFMEEAYRGEPQTIVWAGLPIYQYLSLVSVLGGIALTVLGGPPAPIPSDLGDPWVLGAAGAVGIVYWFAMGVDFPESSRRFARLSG